MHIGDETLSQMETTDIVWDLGIKMQCISIALLMIANRMRQLCSASIIS